MRHRFAAAPLVVLLLASCSDDPAPPPTTFLEGDWTACYTETIATPVDVKATYTFFGPDYAYDLIGYTETADATCGGTGVLLDQDSGTIHVGAQVVADLGGVQVTAQAVDLQDRRTGERRTPSRSWTGRWSPTCSTSATSRRRRRSAPRASAPTGRSRPSRGSTRSPGERRRRGRAARLHGFRGCCSHPGDASGGGVRSARGVGRRGSGEMVRSTSSTGRRGTERTSSP